MQKPSTIIPWTVILAIAVVGIGGGAAAAFPSTLSHQQAGYPAGLESYLYTLMETYNIPGLALGIVRDGEVEYQGGFGRANAAGNPVTPDTPFLLASVSKGITALALMQLVEAGELSLDDRVVQHLPWFAVGGEAGSEITVAQLLYQTSGLTELGGSEANLRPDGPEALEEKVRALAGEELAFRPGESWEYSNHNFDVAGLLVQEISGQPYADYIEEHVFGPLGMANSHATQAEARGAGAANGFYPFFGFPLASDWWMPYTRAVLPSAGLWSSAADMNRYLISLLDPEGSGLVSAEGVETLHTPGHMFDEMQGYAMGWTVTSGFGDPKQMAGMGLEEYAGMTVLFHEGDWLGYKAMAFLVPELEYGSIMLLNTNDPTITSVYRFSAWDVAQIALGGEARYYPPGEPAVVRFGRWLLFGAALLLAGGLVWVLRARRPAKWKVLALAVGAALVPGYLFLGLLPDYPTTLGLMLRFAPDMGLLVLVCTVLAAGVVIGFVRLLRQ